jgi:tetratricopeptide (TPR) repeat protein
MMKILTLAVCSAFLMAPTAYAEETIDSGIAQLQHEWAAINYQTPDPAQQLDKMAALAVKADQLTASWPNRAEPLVWSAIIKSTEAGMKGGMGALGLAKQARRELEQAIAIDGTALNGSAYTSLGSLYYQVPGRPIGFGSKKKALANLQKALAINPDGIDANYFYGDYLMHRKKYKEAIVVFEHALAAPARPSRPIADQGRHQEIEAALKAARSKISG